MPRHSPFSIILHKREKVELLKRARKYTLPYFLVNRAKIILLAAEGLQNDQIAQRLDMRREVVSRWRQRFYRHRLPGLDEHPRPGRPRAFPPRTDRAR